MPRLTFVLGLVLAALGLYAFLFLQTSPRSLTALIPAFFGIPLITLGMLAMAKPSTKKHAIHAAAGLAALGTAGTASGLLKVPQLFQDAAALDNPNAVGVKALMCLLCLGYLVCAIWSFRAARSATARGT